MGGLGNQLFMIFNIIALSIKYNKKFKLYLNDLPNSRKCGSCYKLFKYLKFYKSDNNQLDKFIVYKEAEYKYNEIII